MVVFNFQIYLHSNCNLYEGEPPKTWNSFIKNSVFILACLNFSRLKKYSPFGTIHLSRFFFPLLQTVFKLFNFDAFAIKSASAIFCFTFFTSAKCFPVRTFIIWRNNNNKKLLGPDQVNREAGAQGSYCFWSKSAEHSLTHSP